MLELLINLIQVRTKLSYEALKTSHTFGMDTSGTQTCIQHETCLFQYKTIGSEHMFTSLILTVFGGGSGECVPTIVQLLS